MSAAPADYSGGTVADFHGLLFTLRIAQRRFKGQPENSEDARRVNLNVFEYLVRCPQVFPRAD